MNCIGCGQAAEFERIVVGRTERPVFGVLCRDCEGRHLGPLVNGRAPEGERCCLCESDGVYALPVWDALCVDDGGDVELLEYSVDGDTPRLCGDHLNGVVADDAPIEDDPFGSARVAADD
jgi:hypothetical protein